MKIYLSLFAGLLLLHTVSSRHVDEKINIDDQPDLSDDKQDLTSPKEHKGNDLRHRRKRWYSESAYNYPLPPYYNRRDDRNQQDLLQHISTLLDELSFYIRHPATPPPPQPIYIPYLIPQYHCRCPSGSQSNKTNYPFIDNRWPEMEDTNQNWGFLESDEDFGGGIDYARPISFDPIVPIQVTRRPNLHGNEQAGNDFNDFTTQNPFASPPRKPNRCDAVVLSCCGLSSRSSRQRQCFNSFGCDAYFRRGNVCNNQNVMRILDSFKATYSVLY